MAKVCFPSDQSPLRFVAGLDTDLLDPLDQFALARLLEGGHCDSKLLAPRVSFLDLDIRREFRIGLLAVLVIVALFCFWFPAGVLFPSVPVLWE